MSSQHHSLSSKLWPIVGVLFFCGYLLLSLSSNSSNIWKYTRYASSALSNNPFNERIIHLDLKGAPPRVSHYRTLFPWFRSIGATGLLIEWEDMFPYEGELKKLRRNETYSMQEIDTILELAFENSLEVIPLVQTFGHLEFLLKKDGFRSLSENSLEANTICISKERSWNVIRQMIEQIRSFHPRSTRIHIGADEAYHIAEDEICRERLDHKFEGDVERMKISHITRVANYSKSIGFSSVLVWNDMFQSADVATMKEYNLGDLVVPVVWGYRIDVTEPGYFPEGLFNRLERIFPNIFFATAFKGANGRAQAFVNIDRYLETHKSYVKLYRTNASVLDGRVSGVILTGWSRFSHHLPLCELLSSSLPSLITDMIYLESVNSETPFITEKVKVALNCPNRFDRSSSNDLHFGEMVYRRKKESLYAECEFPGVDIYRLINHLQFLSWKASRAYSVNGTVRDQLVAEIDVFRPKLKKALNHVYYPSAVDEFLLQHVDQLIPKVKAFV